ncbi:MAG: hypothetical protein K2X87_27340, partial [Gemmataceae bacterium]|nr:hypothetical protein [Gemmataceae bacterium]
RLGEVAAARRAWQAVADGFGPIPSEARWVELSRAGLAALDGRPARGFDRRALDAALAHAKGLSGADAALAALEELTRDDPAAAEQVRAARMR